MEGESTAKALPAPDEPCWRCEVRADVGCKHREPTGVPPPAIAGGGEEKIDGRRAPRPGAGLNFHVRKSPDRQ
jgi:hypothetical protein